MQARRASRISEAEWDTRRQKLERLYLDDNLSRQEIIEIMTREDKFSPTERQLKYQFNKWGLKKYISDRDLTTMLSFKRKRQEIGKDTGFVYQGHLFEQERLERASKRRKGPLISSPVLPPYIRALVSPRQSPNTTFFLPAHRQNSAIPDGAEESTHSIERPVSQNLLSNDSYHQSGDFGSSDIWNGLDAFSDPAVFDDGEQNQVNSGLWGTLLENGSVSFSPRRGSLMPNPPRRDLEATRSESPGPLMRPITGTTPYVPDSQTANDNDFPLSDFDLDFDFSMFRIPTHGSSRALSSSSHAAPHPHRPDERMSISPLQLTSPRDTHDEDRELNLVSRTTSAAGLAFDPVTGGDVRAESIASLLGLLKLLCFPRFDTASQKYEYESSVLSDFSCPHCCEWLCFEVEELLDSYLERSLRAVRKRRAARLQGTLPPGSDLYLDEPRQNLESPTETRRLSKSTDDTISTKLGTTFSRRYPTPMGLVVFQVREVPRDSRDKDGNNSNSLITISFMPRAMEQTLGLCARFLRLTNGPAISRQIDTFNVIPDDSAIIQCICKNDLRGVQKLFDLGAASAQDVDSQGRSLLQYAMFTESSDIFRLLLQSGASTYRCDESGRITDVITAMWSNFASANSGMYEWLGISTEEMQNFEHCVARTQLALDYCCTIDEADHQVIAAGPLFDLVGLSMKYAHSSATVDAINYLSSIGWDLEEQNCLGRTPLLHAAAECRPHVARCLRTLIERGARLDARDREGRGPLHSALSPPSCLSDWVYRRSLWSVEEGDSDIDINVLLSIWCNTEDHRYDEDYYDRETTLEFPTASTSPDTSRSTRSLEGIGSNQLVCDHGLNVPAEQQIPIDLSSSDSDSDASSCAEERIPEFDNDEYVYCVNQWGDKSWIRNPARVLKDRVRTKLRILLEAGCDPNDLDYKGESPSDYARDGLWSQWLWALERTGYVFDEEHDRWIKRFASA